jgi:phosphatidylglycerophosphatase A
VGAVPLFLAVRSSPHLVYWGVTLLITALGFWASQRCSELLGDKDPQSVVIDEVSGVMIAMGLVRGASPSLLVAAWISFRILDITKPALIDRSQYLRPSGVGIMADDILAGLVAGALCSAYAFFGGPH